MHCQEKVTPAVLNFGSSLFKEGTFPQRSLPACLLSFSFLFLSLGVITEWAPPVVSNPKSAFPESPSLIPACPCDPSDPHSVWPHQSQRVLRNFKVVLNLEAYLRHFSPSLLPATARLGVQDWEPPVVQFGGMCKPLNRGGLLCMPTYHREYTRAPPH